MLNVAISTIQKAQEKANKKGKKQAIVEMDCDEGRKIYIVDEDYTYSDEFEAFAGEVIYVTE